MGSKKRRMLSARSSSRALVGEHEIIPPAGNKRQRNHLRANMPDIEHSTLPRPKSGLGMPDFVLYQANQVSSDAVFVKQFVAAALDPDKLRLEDNIGHITANTLEIYLSEVALEISNMMDRIIRDAQWKALAILSKHANEPFPFLNIDLIKAVDFSQFGPGSTFDVAATMYDWHSRASRGIMVQYRSADYNIRNNTLMCQQLRAAKPFLDLSDGTHLLPRGRVIPLLSIRRRGPTIVPAEASYSQSEVAPESPAERTSGTIVDPVSAGPRDVQFHSSEKLVTYHKEQLDCRGLWSERSGPFIVEGDDFVSLDTLDIISQAIADRKLRPPSKEVQRQMDEYLSRLKGLTQDHPHLPAIQENEEIQARPTADGGDDIALAKALLAAIYSDEERTRKNHAEREAFYIEDSGRRKTQDRTQRLPKGIARKRKLVDGYSRHEDDVEPPDRKRAKRLDTASSETVKVAKKAEISGQKYRLGKATSNRRRLEPGQQLPESAYHKPQQEGEKFAWRCGIKHALGYYYVAGDRKSCPGCGVNFRQMRSHMIMDFYLPPLSWSFQDAPQELIWTPTAPTKEARKYRPASHNAIAKDAYWAAMSDGANPTAARRMGAQAVLDHIEAKRRRKLSPTLEPEPEREPTPEPVIPPPHPSGSKMMEYGREIPSDHRWEKKHDEEEFAWRCDVAHALGHYYMAGDKKSCAGCGTNRNGKAKQTTMDFYLPAGLAVRQTDDGPTDWKPRRPYKTRKGTQRHEKQITSHNQRVAWYYWELREKEMEHDEAMNHAVEMTEAFLDKTEEAWNARKRERDAEKKKKLVADSDIEMDDASEEEYSQNEGSASLIDDDLSARNQTLLVDDRSERNRPGGVVISLVSDTRRHDEVDSGSEEQDDSFEETMTLAAPPVDSSSDEDVSSSDSE